MTFWKKKNFWLIMTINTCLINTSFSLSVCVVAANGVHWPAENRERLLCTADPGGGPCMEGQNGAAANTGMVAASSTVFEYSP